MTQLALNNIIVIVIEISVFYTNYSRHPNLFNIPKKSLQIVVVLEDVIQLKKVYKKISKNIKYN